jgi:tetratricopeptide (TPR) repeat protein
MFWATAEPGERAALFAPEASRRRLAELLTADLPAEIADSLAEIGRMMGAPEATAGETVAAACRRISDWAEAAGHEATALAYTQAAALSAPRDATIALAVGQISRQRGEQARAETWFRHAIMIGRQTGDWESYARAYIALGNMLLQRGNFPGAHRMHIKALRAARRKGLTPIQGMAAHDLFVIATETGRNAQAEEYARMALRSYGPEHELLPILAHDVAYYWMNQGYFSQVLPIFQSLQGRFNNDPDMQLLVNAHIARASGGAGDRSLFRRYFTESMRMAKDPRLESRAGDVFLELAMGASSLGEWDRAEQAAERAGEDRNRGREHAGCDSERTAGGSGCGRAHGGSARDDALRRTSDGAADARLRLAG